MLKEERLEFILQQLKTNQAVKLGSLSQLLKVSEDTIRRDIETLDREGRCLKVRGGAVPPSPNSNMHAFKDRLHASEEQKHIIAEKALSLISPGQVILLDGGTTTYQLATILPAHLAITVVTNSIPVVNVLMNHPSVEIILAGGRIFKTSEVTQGEEALHLLNQVMVDICFTGICSLHSEWGVTTPYLEESIIKRKMVARARKVVAITTSDKLNTAEPFSVCPITDIHSIVTESNPDNPIFAEYRLLGIEII